MHRVIESTVELLRYSRAYDAAKWLTDRRAARAYERAPDSFLSPPHTVKVRTVREYAERHRLSVLVETGTYRGQMVHAQRSRFRQIHSIELADHWYARALELFHDEPNIRLHHGDSASVLPSILVELDEPALFWLDAHYSGGQTARGEADSPISAELAAILEHHVAGHVLLIDDAREFVGHDGYPTLQDLIDGISRVSPLASVSVADDIIRVVTPR